jgi:predicted RNA methylase
VPKILTALWDFLVDSLPSKKRQRYGDVEYDWEHRVDTTSATVAWRTRLLGHLNSPYQATDAALFHEMLRALPIDFSRFAFIDIGSGKGRTLMMASDYPFRQIIGVELLAELHNVAVENIRRYKSASQRCFSLHAIHGDAAEYDFPAGPLVIYLFNPLPEGGLVRMLNNLVELVRKAPRPIWVVYHNPLLRRVLEARPEFQKSLETESYAIYSAENG